MTCKRLTGQFFALTVMLLGSATMVWADTVKITPLGSQAGEFCQLDRALILEDPDGTRVLYDPGRTVAGADDPRLGKIDAVLVSHMHGDHVGDKHIAAPGNADCKSTKFPTKALPGTNTVPGFAVVIVSMGLLQRDGVMVILGSILGTAWIATLVIAGATLASLVKNWLGF